VSASLFNFPSPFLTYLFQCLQFHHLQSIPSLSSYTHTHTGKYHDHAVVLGFKALPNGARGPAEISGESSHMGVCRSLYVRVGGQVHLHVYLLFDCCVSVEAWRFNLLHLLLILFIHPSSLVSSPSSSSRLPPLHVPQGVLKGGTSS
jgi:hypothetical protein